MIKLVQLMEALGRRTAVPETTKARGITAAGLAIVA